LAYAQCDDYHITADLLTRAGKRIIALELERDRLLAQLFEAKTKFEAKKAPAQGGGKGRTDGDR